MSRPLTLGAIAAFCIGGFMAGMHRDAIVSTVKTQLARFQSASHLGAHPEPPREKVAYYRDPDGRPLYAYAPQKTEDGRPFEAVLKDDEISFDANGLVKPTKQAETNAQDPGQGTRKIKYYRNPMGLPDTSPVPKRDNMGMDYIPVYEGDDDQAVKVAPGRLQATGVRSEAVSRRSINQTIRVPGVVALDERRIAVVATRSDSYVDHVANVTTGDRVRKGEPLLTLYSPEINAAAAQFIANPGFEGSRRRLENLNVPAAAIDEMERTHRVPLAITWTAPRDGIILERNAIEGMKASAGAVLFRIADLSNVWILADVQEHDSAAVSLGDSAEVRLRARPNRVFRGKVSTIYPQLDAATRSTRVRIELTNPDTLLLPHMYADVTLSRDRSPPILAIPEDAVIDTGTRQTVLLDLGGGRYEPKTVKLGRQGEGYVEVLQGIHENDKVVTGANFLIDAESNLKAALDSLASANVPEDHP